MQKKIIYYYIDESGSINNDSNIFILGCIKTDTPDKIKDEIEAIKYKINNELYYLPIKEIFNQQGFHAVDNHPDIRAELYRVIHKLNFRAYFTIVNKSSEFFKKELENKSESEIYSAFVNKLLYDRIIKDHKSDHILLFEELHIQGNSQEKIVENFLNLFKERISVEYKIVGKDETNMSLIDYLNYILYSILNDRKKPQKRMEDNFKLLLPKIALITFFDKPVYLSRTNKIDLNKLYENFDG